MSVSSELAHLGAATVYEASGRRGLVDVELKQLVPGSRACGPARIARCGQDDTKDVPGELDVPVVVGGAEIRPGDLVVLDADGVTVVAAERAEEVLQASLAREAKEADKRTKLQAGALSWELDGLRARV